ncbi:MAG TPA: hypothetical protein VES88_15740 [Gemmatimonadaceae bacterium]|nr:hypothetical protein [Gemmatimonadaceae bacterium]
MCILAVVGGLGAAFRVAGQISSDRPRVQDRPWARVALVVAIICLATALFMIRNALVIWNPYVLPLAVLQLHLSLVAIVVYPTRWRATIEGLAAAALGVFSFLSGFSIGVFIMPFAAALAVVALIHMDERRRALAEVR